jgi:DNA-binding CsgD family transcriptional regulator
MSDREQARAWLKTQEPKDYGTCAHATTDDLERLLTAYAAEQLAAKERECERLREALCTIQAQADFEDDDEETVRGQLGWIRKHAKAALGGEGR